MDLYFRSSSYDGIESYSAGSYATSNKDLLALHNSWSAPTTPIGDQREVVGQDKIIRAFSELMRNMARMKTFIRPSMVSVNEINMIMIVLLI